MIRRALRFLLARNYSLAFSILYTCIVVATIRAEWWAAAGLVVGGIPLLATLEVHYARAVRAGRL